MIRFQTFIPETIDYSLLSSVIFIIGEITVIILIGLFCLAFFLVALTFYSIRKGKLIFPGFLKAGMVLVEGFSKALFSLFGLEDKEMMTFFIRVHNTMSRKSFEMIPVRDRAIFFPQCLRSAKCPANLTPEGLKCINCGQCTVNDAIRMLELLGYRFFIVPGSSFIKRMVKKYRPRAIIGVGCLSEVKEGLDMSDKLGLVALGVVTEREGCVETSVNWEDVFGVALIGIDPALVPDEVKASPWFHTLEQF
ncbi:MAG: DUF116 domain-containing protein [Methanomicrobiales archaeon]|nr:DUF116 domain-containing protein [Methanomicrobiales archaeon]